MRIALIGDIHTYRLAVAPWRLFNKRLMGQVNLWFNRRYRFVRELLPAVWEKVDAIEPDMLLMTGDVSTCALRVEFADTAAMLKPLTDRYPTVLIPGNHDRYIYSASRNKLMEQELGDLMPKAYPHIQRLNDRWHLIALDSARPQPLFCLGWISDEQIAEAKQYIESLDADQSVVVMCHYALPELPPGIHEGPRHGLENPEPLLELLRDCSRLQGPTIYAHGHVHRPWFYRPKAQGMEHVIDLDAGAPCNKVSSYPMGQGFWQVELPDDDQAPTFIHHHREDTGEAASGPNAKVSWLTTEHPH